MADEGQLPLLGPRLNAAAAALANAVAGRRGAPEVTNVLELLERVNPDRFAEVVLDAHAALAAADAADREAPPELRPRGRLRSDDAAALGLELGVAAVLILAVDHSGHLTWADWTSPGRPPFSERVVELVADLARELAPGDAP